MLDPLFGYSLSAAFALLFAQAALQKWRSLSHFEAVVSAYRLSSGAVTAMLKWLVPSIESGVAVALLFSTSRSLGVIVGAAVLVLYAGGIALNLKRGRVDLDCGCAGARDRRPIAPWMVVRNVVMAVCLLPLGVAWSTRTLDAIDWLSIGGALVIIGLLYLTLDRLFGQVMPAVRRLKVVS